MTLPNPSLMAEMMPSARDMISVGLIDLRKLKIELVDCYWDRSKVTLAVIVPDRNNGHPLRLDFTTTFDKPAENEEELVAKLHEAMTAIVAHELAELLLHEGRRVLDPHRNDVVIYEQRREPVRFDRTSSPSDVLFTGGDKATVGISSKSQHQGEILDLTFDTLGDLVLHNVKPIDFGRAVIGGVEVPRSEK